MSVSGPDSSLPLLTISVASSLAGVHPQTLRAYDRLGLVCPARVGRNRLYSLDDVERAVQVASLASRGLPLSSVAMVLDLQDEVARLRSLLGGI